MSDHEDDGAEVAAMIAMAVQEKAYGEGFRKGQEAMKKAFDGAVDACKREGGGLGPIMIPYEEIAQAMEATLQDPGKQAR